MSVVQLLLYVAVAFGATATVLRTVRHARQPAHLRWELYPVAHERGRAAYGGSRLEEAEHWTRDSRPDHVGALRAILAEVFLLAGVRRHNRPLWRFSLLFHLGVYLVVVLALAVLAAGVRWPAGGLPAPVAAWLAVLGFTGLALGFAGAAGLLHRRLTDPVLRAYSTPADLGNLLLWLAYLGWTLVAHAVEGGFASLVRFAGAWARLEAADPAPTVAIGIALGALLLAYLPLSRMYHAVAKYFLYHAVRWDDAPNPPGGALEKRLVAAMDFGVAWRAPHLAGARTWREAADGEPPEEAP